ncbi:hypothetical protein JVT61DRAFT_6681 [Boletus reticuloceps]|uniref:Uncharacterized protein n=1 Tax=Boletus reticuloceps TaxID=495285 RepID=A0A8I2YK35_9AGAM|nr:hypothetical protein JVT61DRAFT_6681 [Boletus reticuloceps]
MHTRYARIDSVHSLPRIVNVPLLPFANKRHTSTSMSEQRFANTTKYGTTIDKTNHEGSTQRKKCEEEERKKRRIAGLEVLACRH